MNLVHQLIMKRNKSQELTDYKPGHKIIPCCTTTAPYNKEIDSQDWSPLVSQYTIAA